MPRKIILNENGFSSYNQKALDSDLRRINLAQRQYVSNYQSEKRKIITKFARKLFLTSLNTNFDINTFQLPPVEPKKKPIILPPIKDKSFLKVESRYSLSEAFSRRSSSMSNIDNDFISQTETPQFGREISNISYVAKSQNNILKPASITAKRNTNDLEGQSIALRLPQILGEQKKLNQINSKRFLNSLGNEDSGFYQLTDSKGKPLCDGLDNYCALLKMTQNNNVPLVRSEAKPVVTKLFRNPFERETPLPPIISKNSTDETIDENFDEIKPVETVNLKKRIETPNKPKILKSKPSSANVFKQSIKSREKEEEEKICNDTFKAQNIRSLTLQLVDIY